MVKGMGEKKKKEEILVRPRLFVVPHQKFA